MPPPEALGRQLPLIEALRNPAAFDGACASVEVIETHISWVLLTGTHAYKIKKAIALPFLDFTDLPSRHRFCLEELRLNRRLAPELYLGVVAIAGDARHPIVDGAGTPIEYAVRMRQFPQSALLSRIAACGELTPADVDALAATVADFHGRIAVCRDGAHGDPDEILRFADDNFRQIAAAGGAPGDGAALARLQAWTRAEHEALRDVFATRRSEGRIRECHGDLHLANVARIDGAITIFDGIEYSEALRWIDVASEIAFTVMDLEDRGQPAYAHRFLDRYLEASGDYDALAPLRFYVVYRGLVRAKVACLRARQLPPGAEREAMHREFHDYACLAERATHGSPAAVVITRGPSGSGKSTVSQALVEALGAVRLRSDVHRKRAFGLGPLDGSASAPGGGLYAPVATRATYLRLRDLARVIVASGHIALVDATCLQRWQRDLFRDLAAELAVPFVIVDLTAPEVLLRQRIEARRAAGKDPSEADAAVLAAQLSGADPLGADEAPFVLPVDAADLGAEAMAALCLRVAGRCGRAADR
jgi:aminoglycoside phosphotransferase family enzyme/predicted kinase